MEYNNRRRHPTRSMLICIFKMNTQQKGSKTVRPAQELAQKNTMMKKKNPSFWKHISKSIVLAGFPMVSPWFPVSRCFSPPGQWSPRGAEHADGRGKVFHKPHCSADWGMVDYCFTHITVMGIWSFEWENLLFLWAIYTMAMLNNQRVYIYILVGGWATPLKNDGVRQLGWWYSQYMENIM